MTVRVGINGFGRMGRLALRAAHGNPDITIVHINEVKGGPAAAAHLLEFDSVHGRWPVPVAAGADHITVEGRRVGFTDHARPADIPWGDLGVDVVIESSGKFVTTDANRPHFGNGARKVVVAAPVKTPGALNIVMGINDHLYDPAQHDLVTAASCTTNCLAPVVKVVHEALGIRHGVITTIHDVTNTQVIVDAPHKDLRRARSALNSLVPTSTGSATAIALIYPELKGKLNGMAVRVPLLNASITDAVFEVARPTTAEAVNALFRDAAGGALAGILGYEERPLVSVDFRSDPRSAIVDALSTMVVDGTQVKVIAWYDNEMGYAHRLAELTATVARAL
ncbi:ArsJ-associated glyceraldehyde-3-phosphate dehydrogenase [Azospirillum halopraeferens]|uniref:ArsJ-associated glyceraldehyde-3-phosphate dehydrogenase n=1 Tax=Azospirillum halopraeferens TaxID=34010 RepID=UPI000420BA8E|nr:ArsJ-associated glyceraldehyde-3-phosphate dehydrogenase [Azospirillum halopraeferens]